MYSPKIAEDLIPVLYRLAKNRGKPMTRIVNEIIREKLTPNQKQKEVSVNPAPIQTE